MSTSVPVAVDTPAAIVIKGSGRRFLLKGYATATRATTLRTLDVYFVFIHRHEMK